MLTIEDIRNPKRKSGFDHVNSAARGTLGGARTANIRWRAVAYGRSVTQPTTRAGASNQWSGPVRKRPEEAAQDYCDYANARPPLTIEDIRNPKRKSGFDCVADYSKSNAPKGRPWRAEIYGGVKRADGKGGQVWRGPYRASPQEAAQDHVDYINGQRQTASAPATLKWPGHPVKTPSGPKPSKPQPVSPKVKVDDDPAGYVYCIGMANNDYAVKIGKSKDHPQYRLAGLQTGTPYLLVLLGYKQVSDRHVAEARHHAHFIQHNILGEWFEKHEDILADFDIKED